MHRRYNAIDIFSGAGGLSLGARMAGINITAAVEMDRFAVDTYRLNFPKTKVFQADICSLDAHQFINKKNPIFLIMGGPPCQGYSMSNTMNRNDKNPKNYLFKEFVRFVDEIRPEWFLFENVWGLTNFEHGKFKDDIIAAFESLQYNVYSKVLYAHNYGVPQKRCRFFIVGNKNGITFKFPEPTNIKGNFVTVNDAISDLPELSNGDMIESAPYTKDFSEVSDYAKLMRQNSELSKQNYVSRNNDLVIKRYHYIRPGHNWSDIPDFLMQNYTDKSRCHSGIYKRLNPDTPSVVISNYRKSMLIHPTQDRGISVREAARLQSFPDTFEFCGPLSYMQQQIGNAVPPLLSMAVVKQILSYSK